MRKYIVNWKFIFGASILFFIGLFFFNQLNDQLRPPSPGWSREFFVNEVNMSKVNDSTRVRVAAAPIKEENKFIILWNEKDDIKYLTIDREGKKDVIKNIKIAMDEPKIVKALIKNDLLYIYSLEGNKLKEYCINHKTEKLLHVKLIENGVNYFLLVGNSVFISGNNFIKCLDPKGNKYLIANIRGGLMDVINSSNGDYEIAFTTCDNLSTIYIKYVVFNPKTGPGKVYDVGKQINSINEMSDVDNIVIGNANKMIYIMTSRKIQFALDQCKRPKLTTNRVMIYSFNEKGNYKVNERYANALIELDPNPVRIVNDDNKMVFLASVTMFKGNKTQMINLREFDLKNGIIIPEKFITKTPDISTNPNYFELGGNKYVVWEDRTGISTKIMFASTNGKMIEHSTGINLKDAQAVFLDTLIDIGFSLSYLLLFFTIIILPTIIFVIIASIFIMNWLETHTKLSTLIAAGIHIAAEIILTYYMVVKKPGVLEVEPYFLQNTVSRYVIVLLLGGISYYCTRLKFRDSRLDKTFINQYAFFAIVNMLLYALVFFPYYYL